MLLIDSKRLTKDCATAQAALRRMALRVDAQARLLSLNLFANNPRIACTKA